MKMSKTVFYICIQFYICIYRENFMATKFYLLFPQDGGKSLDMFTRLAILGKRLSIQSPTVCC